MNNRRNLLIALGAGALTAPLVLRKSGGYAPNVHQPRRAFTLVVAVWAALTMASAAAAEYPTKPIRLMVPSAAGGTPDILARLIASELTKQMAQQVSGTNVLTVTPALPVRSARELIEYARAQPGKLSYGSIG